MEEAEINAERNHEENNPEQFERAYSATERSPARMAELLPNGKYRQQTERGRQLATQQTASLYMARLEETRAEKEKPDKLRRTNRQSVCIQPNAKGRMGNSTKPDTDNHSHTGKAAKERLRIAA